ncbi:MULTISPECIES: DNA replication initiation control protein YabA [Thermoactinomyces]|uniref:DNA replication initiation control protein YabA n=1 Tax=Thermoactinomyces daqus TaxID=1329516 RepID=A0A7W1X9E9_9BACL|nr:MULTISPECIES: DNA replication initiation control protein YabA [Thermoactinomyces]MBA4542467.1 DNA replication initiation control protein YabA [Thermoactinomyces daqus]MBH8598744.1 DNA replication initiation control protein YabA [Thermoactinomyces sp. CICC 10523]MBH8604729.1 DNA replication initiation control protein YabA [Thermoactinomyces sp. CICC 10522]MBH8607445.1 DNA replication initiation control protein YabA [Thermoactinomyces sp. CICC 10521]
MDKEAIFEQVARVEERIGELYKELAGLKEQIVGLIEDNTRLMMENQRLKELEARFSSPSGETEEKTLPPKEEAAGKGVHHLADLYEEGFHICNVHYGRLRGEGDCLFCIAFLNKSSKEE